MFLQKLYHYLFQQDKLIEEYFAYCDSQTKTVLTKKGELVVIPHPKPYTVQGLAVYLDCTMETLLQYQKQDAFSETIKKAKTKIETNKVEGMISGDWNATGVIFDLKNNHDWKDKTESETTHNISKDTFEIFGKKIDF